MPLQIVEDCDLNEHWMDYVLRLAIAHWSEESVELLLQTLKDGFIVPIILRERRFLRYVREMKHHLEITEYIKKHQGYVYLIEARLKADNRILGYKIGFSADPHKRATNIFGAKQPYISIHVAHKIKTDDMERLESRLHNKYNECRDDGEWFNLTAQQVIEFKNLKQMIYYPEAEDETEYWKLGVVTAIAA